MTNIPLQSLPAGEDQYTLADEEHLEVADKQHILEDWQRFMAGGFRQCCFTERLYDFLCHSCAFVARRNRLTFWTIYFNAEAICLRLFLNQFGGNGRSVDFNTHAWLDGPAARVRVKQARCRETARLYARGAEEQGSEGAGEKSKIQNLKSKIASGVPDPGFPPYYLISENTRNLLAYAARIALDQPQIVLKGEGG